MKALHCTKSRQLALWIVQVSDKLRRIKNQFQDDGMVFFKSKPAIDVHDKARIEFHLQEIGESIGFDRFSLPVMRRHQLLDTPGKTPQQIVTSIGKHLSHGTAGLQIQVAVVPTEKCGGGG